jgi:tRNA G26 N,N-dimethylase Trm1
MPDRSEAPRQPTTIERAYQMARSGECRSLEEIAIGLRREGYEAVAAHLAGASIRRDLRQICAQAAKGRADTTRETDL